MQSEIGSINLHCKQTLKALLHCRVRAEANHDRKTQN